MMDLRLESVAAERDAYKFFDEGQYGIASGIGSLAAMKQRAADLMDGLVISHRANSLSHWALLVQRGKLKKKSDANTRLCRGAIWFSSGLLVGHVLFWLTCRNGVDIIRRTVLGF